MLTCKKTEKLLFSATVMINTLKEDQQTKDKISRFGFTDTHLDLSSSTLDDLNTTYRDQLDTRGEQLKLSLDVDKKFKLCYERYSNYVDIFKSVFYGNHAIVRELGLDRYRDPRLAPSSFVTRAVQFYKNVCQKPHVLFQITAALGFTAELFDQEILALNDLETTCRTHKNLMGENQRLTRERSDISLELELHIKRLKGLLRLALQGENPQALERFGIFVRNAPKRKTDATTEPVDPQTTEPVDPQTTEPVDPQTTEPVDPQTTEPVDTQATEPVDTQATEPVDPQATEPVDPQATEQAEPQATEPEEPQPTCQAEPQPTAPQFSSPASISPISPIGPISPKTTSQTPLDHKKTEKNRQKRKKKARRFHTSKK